jgi:hypothetical protein
VVSISVTVCVCVCVCRLQRGEGVGRGGGGGRWEGGMEVGCSKELAHLRARVVETPSVRYRGTCGGAM